MAEKDMEKELKRLEKEMVEAAKNLEFERAAELRDKLFEIKEAMFGVQLPVET
jgi:excinuclease ABC subunit B